MTTNNVLQLFTWLLRRGLAYYVIGHLLLRSYYATSGEMRALLLAVSYLVVLYLDQEDTREPAGTDNHNEW